MKKIIFAILATLVSVYANAQSYNPLVSQGIVSPAPLIHAEFNGTGILSFNIGNTGSDPIYIDPGEEMTLVITLSNGIPDNADPIAALGGTWLSKFNWSYDVGLNTYTAIQNQEIPADDIGNITIQYKVTVNSSQGAPDNGFEVNLDPPLFTNISNTTDDDAVSSYTYTQSFDYGDAPISYGSVYHEIVLEKDATNTYYTNYVFLGNSVDAEADYQSSGLADGDDNNGDDEDGVTFPELIPGQAAIIPVEWNLGDADQGGSDARLNAWIDWNGDGDFLDDGEWLTNNVSIEYGIEGTTSGTYNIEVTVPADATFPTFARFRFGNAAFTPTHIPGTSYGEVEDYQISAADCPVITENTITASQTICEGDAPTGLTGGVPTIDPVTTFTYQWQSSPTGTGTWSDVATTQNYSPGVLPTSTDYRRLIKITGCLDDISNIITITVDPTPYAGTDGTLTVCEGTTPNDAELFAKLGDNPDAGGTWSNVGLVYTYTVSATTYCPSDKSTVTVTEDPAPYAGTDGILTVCEGTTPTDAELFAKLGDNPDAGGTWSGPVSGVYTYTVAATTYCPADESTVTVSEDPAPYAGTDGIMTVCEGSTPSDAELFAELGDNPDTGGTWSNVGLVYTYSLTATDYCPADASTVSVTEDPAPYAGTDGIMTVCEGTAPSDAELFAELGDNPDEGGTWSNVGLVYTYTLTATDYCPADESTVTVTEDPAPYAGTDGVLTVCEGSTPSDAELFARLGDNPDAGGTWSNVGLVYTYTVAATTYCPADESTVSVTEDPLPAAPTLSSISPVCSGEDAIFTITGVEGDVVTYSDAATGTVTIPATGIIDVTVLGVTADATLTLTNVSDGTCDLSLDISETVTVNPLPVFTNLNIDCTGETVNTVTVNATISSGTLEYSINGVTYQSSNIFTGLTTGDYTFYIREVTTLCHVNTGVQSISCDCPTVSGNTITASQTICEGDAPTGLTGGVPTIDPVTTFTYQWQSSPTGTGTWSDVATTQNYSPGVLPTSTDYRRLIKITGCPDEISSIITIVVNSLPTVPTDGLPTEICFGDNSTAIFASVLSGETIDWYANITGGTSLVAGNTSYTSGATAVGVYTYYAEARNISTDCVSSERLEVIYEIKMNPTLTLASSTCSSDFLTYDIVFVSDGTVVSTEGMVDNTAKTVTGITIGVGVTLTTTINGCITELEVTALDCLPPLAVDDNSTGNFPGNNTILNILTNDELSDGTPATVDNTTVELIDPATGNPTATPDVVTVLGEGIWTYEPITGDLTFDPEDDFTSDPTPIDYILTETSTGLTDDGSVTIEYNLKIVGNSTIAENDFNNTYIDKPVTGNVLTNDEDFEGDIQRVTTTEVTSTLGVVVTIDETTGDYSYIPPMGYVGSDVFKYTICDDAKLEDCDTALVFIEILPIGIEPNNCDGKITSLTLRYTGISMAVIKVVQKKDNVVVFEQSIVPGEVFQFYGTDNATLSTEISIFVNDELNTEIHTSCSVPIGTGMVSGNFVIVDGYSVEGGQLGPIENQVYPIANPDNEITQINTPVSGDIISNDFDPDGDILTINTISVNDVTNGSLIINTDGTFIYTPNPNFVGEDTFEYEICDEDNLCSTAIVNITVIGVDLNITQANDDGYNGEVNTAIDGNVLLNDVDINADSQTVTSTTVTTVQGVVVNIDATTGNFTYIPPTDYVGPDNFIYSICDDGEPQACDEATVYLTIEGSNYINTTFAVNDTFVTTVDTKISENVLANDFDREGDNQKVTTITVITAEGVEVRINPGNGNFTYSPPEDFVGMDTFIYTTCDDGVSEVCDEAIVYIEVFLDTDHDGVANIDDIDDDNDGILDVDEDSENDFDGDGIVNRLDIDSDNDGIVDNVEWQLEDMDYVKPTGKDSDGDGWDDAYDPDDGGIYYVAADSDFDGDFDFLDNDSDNDYVLDNVEGHDADFNNIPDVTFSGIDSDGDGLDDAYDNIDGRDNPKNPTGSNSPLSDYDKDRIRDWRDIDDDNDGNSTAGEFNRLSSEECDLFIPEIFSPNDDGIQDYFRIMCIENYPNAKIEVYNRWGNLVYTQENYGNIGLLGETEAWWNGYSNQNWVLGVEKLPPATYFYILYLNDGSKPLNGYLFLNR